MKKRALLSVYNKTGICDFAKKLEDIGYEIIATSDTLEEIGGVCEKAVHISDITGFRELLGGKVRLSHPAVFAGIVAMRSDIEQMNEIIENEYEPIDIVAVNVPDFEYDTSFAVTDTAESINAEKLSVLRGAVKNCSDVAAIVDPADYDTVIEEISMQGEVSAETKLRLAYKVLEFTAHYDAKAASFFKDKLAFSGYPQRISNPYVKACDLKSGENTQQTAAYYTECNSLRGTLADSEVIKGTPDAYSTLLDMGSAVDTLKDFDTPAAVIIKGAVPCSGGIGETVCDAFTRAYRANTSYVTGSVVALNREVDRKTSLELAKFAIAAVLAPSFDEQALEVLDKKEELCLVKLNNPETKSITKVYDIKKISGGVLMQTADSRLYNQNELQCVTEITPDEDKMRDLMLAWIIAKAAKSNAAVVAYDSRVVKICQCIPDTDEAVCLASTYVSDAGSVMATDTAISSADTVSALADAGVCAIIQPGGAANDEEIIAACNERGISMLVTNMSHIKN